MEEVEILDTLFYGFNVDWLYGVSGLFIKLIVLIRMNECESSFNLKIACHLLATCVILNKILR